MKVSFDAQVFLPSYYTLEDVASGRHMPLISLGDENYFKNQGYPKIGTAVVTVTLHSADAIVASQIEALNEQLQAMRAEHQRAQNAILDKISKLQAITYVAGA